MPKYLIVMQPVTDENLDNTLVDMAEGAEDTVGLIYGVMLSDYFEDHVSVGDPADLVQAISDAVDKLTDDGDETSLILGDLGEASEGVEVLIKRL